MVFSCPGNNTDVDRLAVWVEGACEVQCEVCEIASFDDTDPTPGVLSGTLHFGAAHFNGNVSITGVEGYRVFFADSCGRQLGQVLASVRQASWPQECCNPEAYAARLTQVAIPAGATQLAIAINTSSFNIPFGLGIEFTDDDSNETQVVRPTAALARRAVGEVASSGILLCIAALFVLA
jgi:hypothetical protein